MSLFGILHIKVCLLPHGTCEATLLATRAEAGAIGISSPTPNSVLEVQSRSGRCQGQLPARGLATHSPSTALGVEVRQTEVAVGGASGYFLSCFTLTWRQWLRTSSSSSEEQLINMASLYRPLFELVLYIDLGLVYMT